MRKKQEIGIVVAGLLLGLLYAGLAKPAPAVLHRPDYAEEDTRQTIFYTRGDTDTGEVSVTVPARAYTTAQLEQLAEETFAGLEVVMLGENTSASAVENGLSFVDALEGMPFAITWWTDRPELVLDDGTVQNISLTGEETCCIEAELSYEQFHRKRQYTVQIIPATISEKAQFEQALAGEIDSYLAKADVTQEEIALPDTLLAAKLYGERKNPLAALCFPLVAVVVVLYRRAHEKEVKKEQEEALQEALLLAYPLFVNQLALYLSSGITIRSAIRQIIGTGREQNGAVREGSDKGERQTVLNRKLAQMLSKMENGMSECKAYQEFGAMCRHQQYKKLMAVLVQTVQMGGKGVLSRLDALEEEAFLMRREQARAQGERASTKLLLPMVLLLAAVMLLLIVPGFYGMGQGF